MEEKVGVVRLTPLKDMVHEISGLRVTSDSKLAMKEQINTFAEILIKVAADYAEEEGRSTIYEVDVIKAFDHLMYPHTIIDEVKENIQNCITSLDKIKEKSIVGLLGV
jgi:histone H3/H4